MVVEDAVGSGGGSGSGVEVVLVVPSVVVIESVVADRLAPSSLSRCLLRQETDFGYDVLSARSNPFPFYLLLLTNKVRFWYTSVEN